MKRELKDNIVDLNFVFSAFSRVWSVVKRNSISIACLGAIVFVLTFVIIKRQAPVYKATYLISVKGGSDEGLMGVMVNLVSRLGLVGGQVQDGFNNRMVTDLLSSNSTIKKVLLSKGTSANFSNNSLFYYWLKSENKLAKYSEKSISSNNLNDEVVDSIINLELNNFKSKCLKVSNDPLNGYLTIEVNTGSRNLSVELCNAFEKYVGDYYQENFKNKLLYQRSILISKRDSILRDINQTYFNKASLSDRKLNAVTQSATADIQLLKGQLLFMQKVYEQYSVNVEILDNKISIADDVFLVIDSPQYSVCIVPKHALRNSCLIALLFVVLYIYGVLFFTAIRRIQTKLNSERP